MFSKFLLFSLIFFVLNEDINTNNWTHMNCQSTSLSHLSFVEKCKRHLSCSKLKRDSRGCEICECYGQNCQTDFPCFTQYDMCPDGNYEISDFTGCPICSCKCGISNPSIECEEKCENDRYQYIGKCPTCSCYGVCDPLEDCDEDCSEEGYEVDPLTGCKLCRCKCSHSCLHDTDETNRCDFGVQYYTDTEGCSRCKCKNCNTNCTYSVDDGLLGYEMLDGNKLCKCRCENETSNMYIHYCPYDPSCPFGSEIYYDENHCRRCRCVDCDLECSEYETKIVGGNIIQKCDCRCPECELTSSNCSFGIEYSELDEFNCRSCKCRDCDKTCPHGFVENSFGLVCRCLCPYQVAGTTFQNYCLSLNCPNGYDTFYDTSTNCYNCGCKPNCNIAELQCPLNMLVKENGIEKCECSCDDSICPSNCLYGNEFFPVLTGSNFLNGVRDCKCRCKCQHLCPYGFVEENGISTCECKCLEQHNCTNFQTYCQFGKESYTDQYGCERCKCRHCNHLIGCPFQKYKKHSEGYDLCDECLCSSWYGECTEECVNGKEFYFDDDGCRQCRCRRCSGGSCPFYCPLGTEYYTDNFGCNHCVCVKCNLTIDDCPYGFSSNSNGIRECECSPPCPDTLQCSYGLVKSNEGFYECKCKCPHHYDSNCPSPFKCHGFGYEFYVDSDNCIHCKCACNKSCENGFVYINGTKQCECKTCEEIQCNISLDCGILGFKKNLLTGCNTCICNDCPDISDCELPCDEYDGFMTDSRNCPYCRCKCPTRSIQHYQSGYDSLPFVECPSDCSFGTEFYYGIDNCYRCRCRKCDLTCDEFRTYGSYNRCACVVQCDPLTDCEKECLYGRITNSETGCEECACKCYGNSLGKTTTSICPRSGCDDGYKFYFDADNCRRCKCRLCDKNCTNGHYYDNDGNCHCRFICPAIKCSEPCYNGYVLDENRCKTCTCKPCNKLNCPTELNCTHGVYVNHFTKCPTCRCNCLNYVEKACPLFCRFGYKYSLSHDNCPRCECKTCQNGLTKDDCSHGFVYSEVLGHHICSCRDPCDNHNRTSFCPDNCDHGYEIDYISGCRTCSCRKCPLFRNCRNCPNGYKFDENNCQTCDCIECADLKECTLECKYGYQVEDRCKICKCNTCPYWYNYQYGIKYDHDTHWPICLPNLSPKRCNGTNDTKERSCNEKCLFGYKLDPQTRCKTCECENEPNEPWELPCKKHCRYGFCWLKKEWIKMFKKGKISYKELKRKCRPYPPYHQDDWRKVDFDTWKKVCICYPWPKFRLNENRTGIRNRFPPCNTFCQFGYKIGKDNCAKCECLENDNFHFEECSKFECDNYCEFGVEIDENGCLSENCDCSWSDLGNLMNYLIEINTPEHITNDNQKGKIAIGLVLGILSIVLTLLIVIIICTLCICCKAVKYYSKKDNLIHVEFKDEF